VVSVVDPVTAFMAAQAALKGIKAAIAMGKDIQGIAGDMVKFFDLKDVVVKASTSRKSDTAEAMQIVMKAHQLQEQENELKNALVMSGNGDLWFKMLEQRLSMQKERKAADTARKNKAEQFRKDAEEIGLYIMGFLVVLMVVIAAFYSISFYTR
jgi:DNA polymerase III gamma/tau subunit